MIWTGDEIARFLLAYRGQRLLGVVRAYDCVEIVFHERRGARPNLLCLHDDGHITHGFVDDPDEYVEAA